MSQIKKRNFSEALLLNLRAILGEKPYDVLMKRVAQDYFGSSKDIYSSVGNNPNLFESAIVDLLGHAGMILLRQSVIIATLGAYHFTKVGDLAKCMAIISEEKVGVLEATNALPVSKLQKIIVVDDEQDIVDTLTPILEVSGYAAEGYSNPELALQRFKESPNDFQVALIDIRMTPISGVELAQKIIEIRKSVRILFMSALVVDDKFKLQLQELSKYNVVRKPFVIRDLWPQITSAFGT